MTLPLYFEPVTTRPVMKSVGVQNPIKYPSVQRIHHENPSRTLPKTLTWFTQWALAGQYFFAADTIVQLWRQPAQPPKDIWYFTGKEAIPWFHDAREEHFAGGYRLLTLADPRNEALDQWQTLYNAHALHPFLASNIEAGQRYERDWEHPVRPQWFRVHGMGMLMLPDWHDIYQFWLSTMVNELWCYWYAYERPFDPAQLAFSPLLNTLIAAGAKVFLGVTPSNSVHIIAWSPNPEVTAQ